MKLFLDTSSLIKLYHEEEGSAALKQLLSSSIIEQICLSELTEIELPAALWKKVRTGELTDTEVLSILELISDDYRKFIFIDIDKQVKMLAINLIAKYGKTGLRTLDAIQLSSAVYAKQSLLADHFETADTKMLEFMKLEGLV